MNITPDMPPLPPLPTEFRSPASPSDVAASSPSPAPGRKHGRGSHRAAHPRVQKRREATGAPLLPIVATAAMTALAVSAGGEFIDRAFREEAPVVEQAAPEEAVVDEVTGMDGDWSSVAAVAGQSVVSVQSKLEQGTSQGSGVVWDDQGHIVTNHHVIDGASEITVLVGNRGYTATLVGSDAATDLAVLEVAELPSEAAPIQRGEMSQVDIGDPVMAIGSPLGLDGSYTTGIVSALDRPVTTGNERDQPVVTNAIQTSAPLNPGNSGGALVNDRGELIGINSSIATVGGTRSGSIGIGFAIPGDLVEQVTTSLIENGKVEHAWLGLTATDGQQPVGDGSVQIGAEIASIDERGPSARAGLQAGDLITRVDDTTIAGSTQLVGEVRTYMVGDTVEVEVLRDGNPMTVNVTLEKSPVL